LKTVYVRRGWRY